MSEPLTGTTPVFLIRDTYGPDDLLDFDRACEVVSLAPHCRKPDGSIRVPNGWCYVGEADVTLRLVKHDVLVQNKVQSLETEALLVQAEAEVRVTAIRRKINELLALPAK